MRVALLSPYALSAYGGVQEQVLAMSRTLVARGHEVLVVAPGTHSEAIDTPATVRTFGRVTSMPANGSRAPLALAASAGRAAREALRSFRPDVVHFHEPFAPRLAWSSVRSHEWPAVATFHRSGVGVDSRLAAPLLRHLAHGLDRAASVSPAAHDTALRSAGIDSIVLFNGFEMPRFTAFARMVPRQPTFVVVGRLEERKGASVVIDAVLAHNARIANEPWQLLVVGDGPLRHRLEDQVGGDDAVTFLGAISESEKRRVVRESSAVVCPATGGESFGLVLLEAMASEVPVVASDIDGYRQAAGGHATLFAPGDATSCEAAMERALATTNEQVRAAHQHASAWSMDTLVQRYETMYQEAQLVFASR